MKHPHKSMALLVAGVFLAAQSNFAQTTSEPPQAAQQSQEQLQQLVAPIALYPDALVAQILPAASYPEQIVEAVQWMDMHKGVQGDQLAKEVDAQPWDESIKALTQFPAVLANMQENLAWTSELGDAYVNQQQEVSQAIQTMRQRAKQAGNLKDTPQEKVKSKGQTIVIEPSAPDVVYVPEYDPWLVYGSPMVMFPGGIPIPGSTWMVQASVLGRASASGYSQGSGGDGITGTTTGIITAGSSTTITNTSRTAQPSSIGIISRAVKRTSIATGIPTAHLRSIKQLVHRTCHTEHPECIRAPSVGLRMAESPEATHCVDSPALAVSTQEAASLVAAEDSMAAVAAMEAVATDRDVSDLTTEKTNEND